MILSVSSLSLSFGIKTVFENVSFGIEQGDKLAIVGVNGAGKTQLLKIICSRLLQSAGEVHIAKDVRVGYMEQNCIFENKLSGDPTIFEEMLAEFSDLADIETKTEEIQRKLSDPAFSEDEKLRLSSELDRLLDDYKARGGYEYKSRVKSMLSSLGFDEERQQTPVRTLSGGQKTRLVLARLLLRDYDMLILDEPTNHLDIASLEWLEAYLSDFKKTLIVVSHDRFFLDKITNKTLEIENGGGKLYPCAYTEYTERKKKDREADEKHYKLQQREIERMEAFIENQRRWNREKNIIAAESRMKAIERMDKLEKPKDAPKSISMNFKSGNVSKRIMNFLCVRELSKSYPQKPLFRDLTFTLHGGERLFLLGENGVGKSTFLKIISGFETADSGTFEYAEGVIAGYYDQEHQGLDENGTVYSELAGENPDAKQSELRKMLARFMFSADDIGKSVSVLSGGEKARLSFAKLMMKNIDLLILDEPTNHLDIPSREILENAVREYDGTVIAVSHDRYFIKSLATRIIELYPGSHFEFDGGYEDFCEYKNKKGKTDIQKSPEATASERKNEYIAAKQEKSAERKRQKRLADVEREIAEGESRIGEINTLFESVTDYVKTQELFAESQKLNSRLEELYAELEELI